MNKDAQGSVMEGARYEKIVLDALKRSAWTDIVSKPKVGDSLNLCPDFEATDPSGQRWWIEAKGGQKASVHTDSTLKAIALGGLLFLERNPLPYLVVYEREPTKNSSTAARLQRAIEAGWVTKVEEVRTPRLDLS